MKFEEYYFTERQGILSRNLIVVDIQPLYEDAIKSKFSIEDFGDFLAKSKRNILYFYNGPDTIGSDDSPEEIIAWLIEHNPDLESFDWDKVNFHWFDKGYSFFRDWMDAGVSNHGMQKALRYMYQKRLYDSREISVEEWEEVLPPNDFRAIEEAIREDGLSIWTPDISIADLKNNWNGSLLCGGGMNECLKEIQLLMNSFNIKYKLVDRFIY
ncbi:MAG: hypothetical protein ACOC5T_03155 [Elusimicrobiota bacterium]